MFPRVPGVEGRRGVGRPGGRWAAGAEAQRDVGGGARLVQLGMETEATP